MKDLVKLHQQNLSHLEAAPGFICNVHVTRLKKGILKRIPGYLIKKWKILSLSLDGENGQALFKASKNSTTN